MKALVFEGLGDIVFRNQPEPDVPESWSLLRVEAAGICGSDMRGYIGTDQSRIPPLIMGHEVAGLVLDGPSAGRRAIVNPMITCGSCRECVAGRSNLCLDRYAIGVQRPGGFAEFVAVPDRNVIAIPDDMNLLHAALAEPAATSLRCVTLASKLLHRPLPEAKSLVIGGGAIGLLSALWLKSYGVREVTLSETNRLRRATAAIAGFQAIDPMLAGIEADSFDLIIDAVGGGVTRELAIRSIRRGGVIVHVGLMDSDGALDMRRLTTSEIVLIGSYTYLPKDILVSIGALRQGILGKLDWVERRGLSEGPSAFAELSQSSSAAAKIVLVPSG